MHYNGGATSRVALNPDKTIMRHPLTGDAVYWRFRTTRNLKRVCQQCGLKTRTRKHWCETCTRYRAVNTISHVISAARDAETLRRDQREHRRALRERRELERKEARAKALGREIQFHLEDTGF